MPDNRALTFGVMGLLFGRLLAIDLGTYLPHLAVGTLVWMFLRSLLLPVFVRHLESAAAPS